MQASYRISVCQQMKSAYRAVVRSERDLAARAPHVADSVRLFQKVIFWTLFARTKS
jgi:hypothetical protein